MGSSKLSENLADQAQQFYDSDDLSRFGRESLNAWEEQLASEMLSLSTQEPLVVELGCGQTKWNEIPGHYVAYDLGIAVLRNREDSRIQGDMQRLPFRNKSIDFIFSIAAIEHVPFPELVLEEIARVLKPGGKAFLAPAWFCRPWAAKGLPVKSYGELSWPDKVAKASLVIRDHFLWRSLFILPRRLWRELRWLLTKKPLPFDYQRLHPNLEEYVMSDSDAFTSMDPHAAIMFFISRGFLVLPGDFFGRVLVFHVPVIVQNAYTKGASFLRGWR